MSAPTCSPLGSILCEILTGTPAYTGKDRYALERRAEHADLTETLGRLERCGADAALTTLCRACLGRSERAGHATRVFWRVRRGVSGGGTGAAAAGGVGARGGGDASAGRTGANGGGTGANAGSAGPRGGGTSGTTAFTGVGRSSAAATRGVGVGAWWMQQVGPPPRLVRTGPTAKRLTGLERARQRLDDGWRLHDLPRLKEGKSEAERAADIARSGASEAVEQQVAAFRTEAQERAWPRGEQSRPIAALLDIAGPHETRTYQRMNRGP